MGTWDLRKAEWWKSCCWCFLARAAFWSSITVSGEGPRVEIPIRKQYNPQGICVWGATVDILDCIAIFNFNKRCCIWKGGTRLVVGQFAQGYFNPSLRSALTNLTAEICRQFQHLACLSERSLRRLVLLFLWGIFWNNSAVRAGYHDYWMGVWEVGMREVLLGQVEVFLMPWPVTGDGDDRRVNILVLTQDAVQRMMPEH